jgi:hypothetical protein
MMLDRIEGNTAAEPSIDVRIDADLVFRRSTGPMKARR